MSYESSKFSQRGDRPLHSKNSIGKMESKCVERVNKCNQGNIKTQGENLYKCNLCDYTSSWTSTLRPHLKTHSGDKSKKCNQCEYTSSQSGDLREHLKTHTGEKTNQCNQCDYTSSCTGNLRAHLKTHSGENKQMQPMRVCIIRGRSFEDACKNAQRRKVQ